MDECTCWPENDSLSGKWGMAITEIAGRENLYFFNLDESPFYVFLIQLQIFNLKMGIIIPCQALYTLPLLLLNEFTSVHAISTSDCRPEQVTDGGRQTAYYEGNNFQYPETRPLTLSEFRLLYLFIMKDIPYTSPCSACEYQELSEKMQLTHNGISVYMKRSGI